MAEIIKERLDISKFEVSVKDNPNVRTNMAVVGLGATGSAFMMLLAHYLKYVSNHNIFLYDFDRLKNHNNQVSMYGFTSRLSVRPNNSYKTSYAKGILKRLLGTSEGRPRNNHNIYVERTRVTTEYLEAQFGKGRILDVIFVFTDTNESRYEVAQYHELYPETVVFDIRVGSYDQFEVYMSKNPSKYNKTIYFEDDGTLTHIDGNRVCLDDRMSFSIAMTGSSMLMNLFTKYMRGGFDEIDFKHIMIGNDYLGEVKGYE